MTPEDTAKACKVWYDPKCKWYRIFTPEGKEIIFLEGCIVSVDDNFGKYPQHSYASVAVSFLCEVVNEEPKHL